jgi:hypothetical protein
MQFRPGTACCLEFNEFSPQASSLYLQTQASHTQKTIKIIFRGKATCLTERVLTNEKIYFENYYNEQRRFTNDSYSM